VGKLKNVEEQDTRQIVKEVLGIFAQNQDDFSSRYAKWAAWDDTYTFNEVQMPPDFQALHSSLSVKEQILARPLSKQTIAGYALLSDIYSKPALLLWVNIPRRSTNKVRAVCTI